MRKRFQPHPQLLMLPVAAAQAAPKPGDRTQPPSRIAPSARVDPEAEMKAAIAAADAHPLGSPANPVRAAGPDGERAYLARLRCSDGKRPDIIPGGNREVGAYGSVVDLFTLDCHSSAPGRVDVVMDMYQEENVETRPVAGFVVEGG